MTESKHETLLLLDDITTSVKAIYEYTTDANMDDYVWRDNIIEDIEKVKKYVSESVRLVNESS